MGCTGEVVAERFSVSREEQDRYALNSHLKAVAAIKEGRFDREIVPIEIPQKKGAPLVVRADEGPREDTSLEALAKLKPAFKQEGTVTAGNAPGVNDGAAALVVASDEVARRLGRAPLARERRANTCYTASRDAASRRAARACRAMFGRRQRGSHGSRTLSSPSSRRRNLNALANTLSINACHADCCAGRADSDLF
jgi:hypothetical protein